MKKVFVLIICVTAWGTTLFAQEGWPDIEKYAELLMSRFVDAGTDWKEARMGAANTEVAEKYASLQGGTEYFDAALELTLYTFYYVFSRNADYSVPFQAEAILPRSNPRLVDRQLGAMVYKELVVTRFLGNSAAAAKWEAVLKTITDRGNVTRAEVEAFYRQNIGALIAAAVDEEFNRIKFVIENTSTSPGAILTRDTKSGQYILSYEGYYTDYVRKILSAPTLAALEAEMRKNRTDFDEAGIQSLRNNATLIPATRLRSQALENIKVVLGNFYISPNPSTYAAVKEIYLLFANKSTESGNQLFEMVYFSYTHTLTFLDNNLLNKVITDANATKSFVALSREQREIFTQTVPAR